MSGVSKITAERNHKLLLELLSKPGNDICADCKARNPRWASHNLGIFICVNCASIHRKMGTHISKVRSLTLDSWTKEQVESMKAMGNLKSNAIYNSNETRYPPPPAMADPENDPELESYIRSKYQYKQFMDKSAFVALKLGPSRTAANVAPQPASSPVVKQRPPASISLHAPSSTPYANKPPTQTVAPPQRPLVPIASSTSQLGQQQKGGVWMDLISLQEPTTSSSLPLQYQAPAGLPTMAPTGVGLGVAGGAFARTLPATSPQVMSYQTSFSQTPQTPGFAAPAAFVSSAPSSVGFITPVAYQVQQQFPQPQPLQVGSTFAMPQPTTQQYTSPSPALLPTPSPALGPYATPSPQLPIQSPGVTYVQSTVTTTRPAVGLAGTPQMLMSIPTQQAVPTGFMPSMYPQAPMGYTPGVNFQAQSGFGNTAQHQWGPL